MPDMQFEEWPAGEATITHDDLSFSAFFDPAPPTVQWQMSEDVFFRIRSVIAQGEWRKLYRAARVLGNRQLAFDRVGMQRSGF